MAPATDVEGEAEGESKFSQYTQHFTIANAKIIALVMVVVAVIYHRAIHDIFKKENGNCGRLLTHGRFDASNWQPEGCMIHKYTKKDAQLCFQDVSFWKGHTRIVFIGDSRIRDIYYEFFRLLGGTPSTDKIHKDLQYTDKQLNLVMDFLWHPYLDDSMQDRYKQYVRQNPEERPSLIVTGVATWYIKYLNANPEALDIYKKNLTQLLPYFSMLKSTTPLLWTLQEPVEESQLKESRAMITNAKIDEYNQAAGDILSASSARVWSSFRTASMHSMQGYTDGLHTHGLVKYWDIQMLLNLYCNDRMNFIDGSCCKKPETVSGVQLATAVFFGACLLLSSLWTVCKLYHCPRPHKKSPLPIGDDKPSSDAMSMWDMFYDIVVSLAKLGIIMGYFFLCDRENFFMKENKHYTHVRFLVPLTCVLVAGLLFTKVTKQTAVLHRDQTDEWKGWMQLFILVYHISGASKVIVIYMQIRVLVSSYLFMSGYGHFFYFWNKGDYSLYRFSQVMFRMNFLVVVLCFVMGRPYQFYYFVPLVSFWFLVIYITMAMWPQVTAGSADANKQHYVYMLLKFAVFAFICTLLYIFEPAFNKLFLLPPLKALFVLSDNSIHEWRFRWWLDRFSTLYGMMFAFLLMMTRKFGLIEESAQGQLFKHILSLALWAISLGGYGVYTLFTTNCQNKPDCNNVHAYVSFVPIVSFVLLRNLPAWLRIRYSVFFAWFGQISLELFISQYHIWLAADTVGALVLVPGHPLLNICITTFIFVCVAHEIHVLTGKIVGYCVPKDWKLIVRNAACFVVILLPVGFSHGAFSWS